MNVWVRRRPARILRFWFSTIRCSFYGRDIRKERLEAGDAEKRAGRPRTEGSSKV